MLRIVASYYQLLALFRMQCNAKMQYPTETYKAVQMTEHHNTAHKPIATSKFWGFGAKLFVKTKPTVSTKQRPCGTQYTITEIIYCNSSKLIFITTNYVITESRFYPTIIRRDDCQIASVSFS